MDLTGTFRGLMQDWKSHKFLISVEVNEDMSHINVGELQNRELDITLEEHKEKRSLSANAYFHVLNGKLADKLRISKPRMKNILLYRYGQAEMIDGAEATMHSNVPPSKILEQEELHCFPIGTDYEGLTIYRIQRNSRTYNSLEFSILLDGVIDECKENGIETMTPEQVAHLLKLWEEQNG